MSISERADKFVQKVFGRPAEASTPKADAPAGSPQRAAAEMLKEIQRRRETLLKLRRGGF